MKLSDLIVSELHDIQFDEQFIIEFLNTELNEEFQTYLDEYLTEAATVASMTNTAKSDTEHIGTELPKAKFIAKIKALIEKEYKKAWKKPVAKPKPIMRIRYVTKGASKAGKDNLKKFGVKAGGKPVEIIVYPPNKGDVAAKEENVAKGTAKDVTLKKNQYRVKMDQEPGKFQTITLDYVMGAIIAGKLYTIQGSGRKILDYAAATAPVIVDARERVGKLAKKFNFRTPSVSSIKDVEKSLVDAITRDRSKAAQLRKTNEIKAQERKEAGIKDDYAFSVYSYRNGKAVVEIKLNFQKFLAAYGVTSVAASNVPEDWTGTKKEWAEKGKEILAEITDTIQETMGANASVNLTNRTRDWVTIYHKL